MSTEPQLDSHSFDIDSLGTCDIETPLSTIYSDYNQKINYIDADDRLLYEGEIGRLKGRNLPLEEMPSLELAGPRRKIFFDPQNTACGIVTCGGLCPGLNDVIRGLVLELYFNYGVRKIYGFRHGYQGFIEKYGYEPVALDPEEVDYIQEMGGTILSSSRGPQDTGAIVDTLVKRGINILFTIGGDGTTRGALAIADEIDKRKLPIAVVGIPKTIDNDVLFIDESFGFQTAYSKATEALRSAHMEAKGAPNGVGLVKLMGRHSGFIACNAALAMSDVNFVLIPEVNFNLEGEKGFLETLRKRLEKRHHAVIALAEGAGQNMIDASNGKDASGNAALGDIGLYLKDRIKDYFAGIGMEMNLKYIDPSYIIRSVPASPQDSVYCGRLARNAVHAAMCGKTRMLAGRWHGHFVHIPMRMAVSGRKNVDPGSDLWLAVLEATGQPPEMV